MEDDVGVKVTVTRLRRRMSVEQSEDGSSPGPSTPSKKRGGRLTAKPQLELIDENTPVSSPRKTRRKSLATDTEEKPITPSRRSARIKSNSSIVSETFSVQATDSPRAKRAARRNSQAGSDNEGPVTPARQTRRTRKDSASSVENQESGILSKPLPVAEMVIEEEPENEVQKPVSNSKSSPTTAGDDLSPNSARKSTRLLEKCNRRSDSYKTDQDCSMCSKENKSLNVSTENDKAPPETQSVETNKATDYLSESNMSLLKKLEETESKRNDSYDNKSASALDVTEENKSKRKRTVSWQEVVASVTIDSITFSDTELSKKEQMKSNRFSGTDYSPKINKSNTSINEKNTSHSFLDISSTRNKRKSESNTDTAKPCAGIPTSEVLSPKEYVNTNEAPSVKTDNTDVTRDIAMLFENPPSNVQATVYFEDSDSNSIDKGTVSKIENADSEDQRVPEVNVTSSTEKNTLLNQINNDNDKSNTDINVLNLVNADKNNSCEPMDIDETIHEEILQKSLETSQESTSERKSISQEPDNSKRKSSISESVNVKRTSSLSKTSVDTPDISENAKRKSSGRSNTTAESIGSSKNNKRKSSLSNSAVDNPDTSKSDKRKSSISDTPDQSKKDDRLSSISNSSAETPDLNKNYNNTSTLILSQLKDVSTTSENPKSPKSKEINEVLSKSDINRVDNKNKKMLKGNLSLNDGKGTPKQTLVQNISMQTSTPITAQQLGTKTKIGEQTHETAKNHKSYFSKSMNETDSSEEDSDDGDDSVKISKFLDDEADEASDDYESGDSQDKDDRRYEAENEIVERGETLTSDDDASNDTDYEKDSFVVSSDAEDNELLSGSGDDLSMSDNELSMSKKSKKKFNDRKLKERKSASREMFESRHKLNTSDKNSAIPKTKKNRMRIDSSLLASDEELAVKPKKNKRMRLDSTLDTSVKQEVANQSLNKTNENKSTLDLETSAKQGDANISVKNKKDKSAQESVIDEKEITVFNESTTANADPLQIQLKQEPKTPQRDLNISVIQVQEDIENVQVLESNSIWEHTCRDPLQATVAYEETSDSSESEEILQNYDSVLNALNRDNKTKLNNNISLNIDNKSKKSHVEPIIDQLNLTHTKKSKKNKDQPRTESDSKTETVSHRKQDSDNEDSSNSIDLQLLFSEDNCGSEDEDRMSQQNKADGDSMFIPLKKSPGKTNLRENMEINTLQQDTTLNSSKKKKNRKSSLGPSESVDEQDEGVNHSILNKSSSKKNKISLPAPESQEFEGMMNVPKSNTSLNDSVSKKKKKKHSISDPSADESQGLSNAAETELNESTNKKKKRKSSLTAPPESDMFFVDTIGTLQDNKENTLEQSNAAATPKSEKKKKKHSLSEPPAEESQENAEEESNAVKTPKSEKKKKKHSTSEPPAKESQENKNEKSSIVVTPKSEKKKKKHSISEPSTVESQENAEEESNVVKTPKSEKKKNKHSISEPPAEESQGIPNATETDLNESIKKKKKRNSSLTAQPEGDLFFVDTAGSLQDNDENTAEVSIAIKTPKSDKKKKKQKLQCLVHDDDSDGAPDEAPYQSEKATEIDLQNLEQASEPADESSAKKKHKKKKKKKSAASNQSGASIDTENSIQPSSKKRKRKSSGAENTGEFQEAWVFEPQNELVASNKKRKISQNEDMSANTNDVKQFTENKKKNLDVHFQDTASTFETSETHVKKNKKRKHRDEDGDSKKSKVSKDSSFQEVHVPRLPESILRQLDDKPRKTETAKVISTSNFIVENARQKRAKPSNYLEESIYLGDKSPLAKKEKPRIKNPKVLPFVPTASISDSGFTTNFKINKLTQFTAFEAEPVVFSKESYLQNKKIKRMGTYDRYKQQMHHKISKF